MESSEISRANITIFLSLFADLFSVHECSTAFVLQYRRVTVSYLKARDPLSNRKNCVKDRMYQKPAKQGIIDVKSE